SGRRRPCLPTRTCSCRGAGDRSAGWPMASPLLPYFPTLLVGNPALDLGTNGPLSTKICSEDYALCHEGPGIRPDPPAPGRFRLTYRFDRCEADPLARVTTHRCAPRRCAGVEELALIHPYDAALGTTRNPVEITGEAHPITDHPAVALFRVSGAEHPHP